MLSTLSKARFAATWLKPFATVGKRLLFLLIAFVFLALTPISSAHAKPIPPPDYLSTSSYIVRPRYLKPPLPPSGTESNPCAYKTIDTDDGGADFQNPRTITSQNQVLQTALEVKYRQTTIAGCPVNLRSYDENNLGKNSLVGPTLRVKPGDTIKIQLSNSLPDDPSPPPPDINTPHGFNNTNFHTHGLHVSPSGISDNVLRKMIPQAEPYDIEVQIPEDHPGGTFWYHAHLHGSTALQVSSGMGGALIVEGGQDQLPTIKNAEEKIFVLQQIAYDEHGKIESYNDFAPNQWQESKRQTTINGQIIPVIKMQPGEVQRWRFIHAGVRETVNLQLRDSRNTIIKLNEIAVDGIPLGQLDDWNSIELNPGYRSDVLVKANLLLSGQTTAEYLLYDMPSPADKSLLGVDEVGQLLAKVEVSGTTKNMDLPTDEQLAAIKAEEAPPDFTQSEIAGAGEQEVVFKIATVDNKAVFSINDQPYDPEKVRKLTLNAVDKWTLETTGGGTIPAVSHPFHIHVNPFQIERTGPDGKTKEKIWKDTLLIKPGPSVTMLTRYTVFTGEFVIHCHILDHEDQGMMQNVSVTAPAQS